VQATFLPSRGRKSDGEARAKASREHGSGSGRDVIYLGSQSARLGIARNFLVRPMSAMREGIETAAAVVFPPASTFLEKNLRCVCSAPVWQPRAA